MTARESDGAPHTGEGMGPGAAGPVLITGGTGFVGSNLRLAMRGRPIRLLVRDAGQADHLRGPDVEIVQGDITQPGSLAGALAGCSAVIHLVGIIEEAGSSFDTVIRQGTVNMLAATSAAGIRRFVHMSALGARDDPELPYMRAKWQAEEAVRSSGLDWTILRPSVIFGPGDGFINPLAGLVRAPITPVAGDGTARFMPIAVEEVAEIFAGIVDDQATIRETCELGGGAEYTLAGMLDAISAELGQRHPRVNVPVPLITLAVRLSAPLPKALRPPVTIDQLRMLKIDNITRDSATERLLGRPPQALANGLGYLQPGATNHPPD